MIGNMEVPALELDARQWLAAEVDLLAFDRRVHAWEDAAPAGVAPQLVLSGSADEVALARPPMALRYQRLWPQRNRHSEGPLFAQVLVRHRALHALEKPLVRADYDHAWDVWQWVLRLSPEASLAVQVAALFHDVERLASEADVRIEHTASDYLAFKQAHARTGAAMLRAALRELAVPADALSRAEALVERHEQPERDPELALLNDADCLSFFALNSPGFLRYYGPAHSAKKVTYTLGRMSPRARVWLPRLRLEPTLEKLTQEQLSQLA